MFPSSRVIVQFNSVFVAIVFAYLDMVAPFNFVHCIAFTIPLPSMFEALFCFM